jgi:hypothetical protein
MGNAPGDCSALDQDGIGSGQDGLCLKSRR